MQKGREFGIKSNLSLDQFVALYLDSDLTLYVGAKKGERRKPANPTARRPVQIQPDPVKTRHRVEKRDER